MKSLIPINSLRNFFFSFSLPKNATIWDYNFRIPILMLFPYSNFFKSKLLYFLSCRLSNFRHLSRLYFARSMKLQALIYKPNRYWFSAINKYKLLRFSFLSNFYCCLYFSTILQNDWYSLMHDFSLSGYV